MTSIDLLLEFTVFHASSPCVVNVGIKPPMHDIIKSVCIPGDQFSTVTVSDSIELSQTRSGACLVIAFQGTDREPRDKFLQVNRIELNNTSMNVLALDYTPNWDEWYQSLDKDEQRQQLSKVIRHNGYFGWYGEIVMPIRIHATSDVMYRYSQGMKR